MGYCKTVYPQRTPSLAYFETTYGGAHALRVTYTIVDNGPLDTDADVSEIADPVGLGVLAVTTLNTGFGSN